MPVFDLVIAKGGTKLEPAVHLGSNDLFHGMSPRSASIHNGHLVVHAIAVKDFAKILSGEVDRTVIDKTGLSGVYDILLDFAPEYGNGPSPESTEYPIFSALQQQLGLKLEGSKGPVETVVIDHVEQPTPN